MKKSTLLRKSTRTLLPLSLIFAQSVFADVQEMQARNGYRWSSGSTQGFESPWVDGNEIVFKPLEASNIYVDRTVAPSKITFAESNLRVTLKSGTIAKIDFGEDLGAIETSSTGSNYIDVALYGTGGLKIINNAATSYTGSTSALVLQKDNSNLTGGITVEKGFVSPGVANAFGDNFITLKNNGGISFVSYYQGAISNNIYIDQAGGFRASGTTGILSGVISGSGTMTIGNSSTNNGIYFTGENTFDGAIKVAYGKVYIGNGGSSGSFKNVSNISLDSSNAYLVFNRSDSSTFSSNISGSGKLEQLGSGETILKGTNTFTGGITITSGTLSVASQSNLGNNAIKNSGTLKVIDNASISNSITATTGAKFEVANGKTATFTSAISSDTFTKTGGGTAVLKNISKINNVESLDGIAEIQTNSASSLKTINANATIQKSGSANLKITESANVANGGSLKANEGSLIIDKNATLSNKGSVSGNVIIANGAVYEANANSSAQKITLQNGANIDYYGGSISNLIFGESSSDLSTVNFYEKAMSINSISAIGTAYLDITTLAKFGISDTKVYLFKGFDASLLDLSNYKLSFIRGASELASDTSGIYFNYTPSTTASLVYNGTSISNKWDVDISSNWLNNGISDKFYQWDNVLFDNSAQNKTVVISDIIKPLSITVNSSSKYTFTGDGTITGTSNLVKKGTGELVIENENSYEGGTSIEAGTLTLKNLAGLGSGFAKTSGGILNFAANGTFENIKTLSSGETLNLSVEQGYTTSLKDVSFVANSTLAKSGSGTLKIDGANIFASTLNVNQGTLELADINATISGKIDVKEAATLLLSGTIANPISSNITLNRGTLSVSTSSNPDIALNLNGTISGTGNLTFESEGTYAGSLGSSSKIALDKNSTIKVVNKILYMENGANLDNNCAVLDLAHDAYFDFYRNNKATFSGLTGIGTVIAANQRGYSGLPDCTLVLGNGTSSSDTYTFEGIISAGTTRRWEYDQSAKPNGLISLVKIGAGTQIITGYNEAVSTKIEGGTLQFGNGIKNGTNTGTSIENNAKLVVNNGSDQSFVSAISGTGSLIKEGVGTLTLYNKSTYAGDTIINSGTLRLGSSSLANTTTVMPFGDSITNGNTGTYSSYRGYLKDLLLVDNTGKVSFVGTQDDGSMPEGFKHHAGIEGDTIVRQIAGGDRNYLLLERANMKPNAVLMHFGINDINAGKTQAQMAANMTELLKEFYAISPDTTFYMATLVPDYSPFTKNYQPAKYERILAYNQWIRDLVANPAAVDSALADKKFVLVELSLDGGFPSTETNILPDSLHPTNNGYSWMASQWYAALMENMGSDNTSALPSNTNVSIASGATLDVNDKILQVATISGAGNVALGGGLLTLNSNQDAEFSGVISGTGGLFKRGTNTVVLSGENTYTGATSVENGTLRIDGTLNSTALFVSNSARLEGSGTVNSSTQISGELALGSEHDSLTFTSDVALLSGSTFSIEIGEDGMCDFIKFVGGSFSIADGTVLKITNLDSSAIGKTYKVFEGTTATGNFFDSKGEALVLDQLGNSYVFNTLGELSSAVPEPSTYAAIFGAIALAFAAYRKRK